MTHVLGDKSRAALVGVHPVLVQVVTKAITLTKQDFIVFEGVRSLTRQRELVAKGASKTMNSMHIKQKDGFGHAVDLVPWMGKPVWEWDGCYEIAFAVDAAATALGVAGNIRWGGIWDKRMSAYGGSAMAIMKELATYRIRHAGPDFVDGPHYEYHA